MLITGVEKIDYHLNGGIKKGSIALINSDPGINLVEFQLHLIRAQPNAKTLYIVNNKKPDIVQDYFRKTGVENVYILDCFSGLMCVSSGFDYVENPTAIESTTAKIQSLIEQYSFDIVVFDSLTMLYDQLGEDETRKYIEKIADLAEAYQFVPLFLFTTWDFVESEIESLRDSFDYIIDLKLHQKKIVGNEMIRISKVLGKPTSATNLPYKLVSTGIRLFVPKILVTGPYFAGKTTVIHALSSKAVSVEREKTTVALDHGHIDYKGHSIDLFGTPGQKRFDPVIRQLAKDAMGVIFVVDSTDASSFDRANEILSMISDRDVPMIVIANKSDLKPTLSIDEVHTRLHIKDDVPVLSSSALQKENLDNVLELLLELIFR